MHGIIIKITIQFRKSGKLVAFIQMKGFELSVSGILGSRYEVSGIYELLL